MHSLPFSGIVHQGWRSVAESGLVANWMGDAGEVLVYITQCGGRWACRPIVLMSFFVFGYNVLCRNDSFGSGIRQVVAFDVCVSSDFV